MRTWIGLTGLAAALALTSTPMAVVATADTSRPSVVSYVSLGDSVTTTTPSFVDMVARDAGATLHRKAVVTGIVEDGAVATLAARVRTEPTLRAAIKAADLITITIGANEIAEPANKRKAERAFEQSYRVLLDRLTALRPASKAAYRLLTSFDTPSAFPPAVGKSFTAALRTSNGFVCAQAALHAMKCADVYAAFNGADGLKDPLEAGLVVPDGHPSAKGSRMIARTVTDLGYAPLR